MCFVAIYTFTDLGAEIHRPVELSMKTVLKPGGPGLTFHGSDLNCTAQGHV